jgi:urease accessory protein
VGRTFITIDMYAWLPELLQTSDTFFPAGAYAHSAGLEGVVQRGLVHDAVTLQTFLQQVVVPTLTHVDLPFVRHAHESMDVEQLCQLDTMCGAMKAARELRESSSSMGARRLELLSQLTPNPLWQTLQARHRAGVFFAHVPIVFGVQTALARTPVAAALAAYYYQGLVLMVSAAMKLIRIGQNSCQHILTDLLRNTGGEVAAAMKIDIPDIGWFSPVVDIASAQHETAYNRLFIS